MPVYTEKEFVIKCLLEEGKTYEEIIKQAHTSRSTISKVKKRMESAVHPSTPSTVLPSTTTKTTSTLIHRPSKIQFNMDNINWLVVLQCMDRGISTIKNKQEVKDKVGAYYYDFLQWTKEKEKIEELSKLAKLLEG